MLTYLSLSIVGANTDTDVFGEGVEEDSGECKRRDSHLRSCGGLGVRYSMLGLLRNG